MIWVQFKRYLAPQKYHQKNLNFREILTQSIPETLKNPNRFGREILLDFEKIFGDPLQSVCYIGPNPVSNH